MWKVQHTKQNELIRSFSAAVVVYLCLTTLMKPFEFLPGGLCCRAIPRDVRFLIFRQFLIWFTANIWCDGSLETISKNFFLRILASSSCFICFYGTFETVNLRKTIDSVVLRPRKIIHRKTCSVNGLGGPRHRGKMSLAAKSFLPIWLTWTKCFVFNFN